MISRKLGAFSQREIVGVLVAAGDGQNAGPQNVAEPVNDTHRIAPVGNDRRQLLANPKTAFGLGQNHHTAIRSDPPAVERGGDLLAANGWKRKRQKRIVGHGGCGAP